MNKALKVLAKYIIRPDFRKEVCDKIYRSGLILEKNNPNSELSFCVFERQNQMAGTFSDYIYFLSCIECGLAKGLIPVIDRCSTQNVFLSNFPGENTWEFFFEQPMNYRLNELDGTVYRCFESGMPISLLHCRENHVIAYWRSIAKEYIRFNDEMKRYLSDFTPILNGKRTLGVSIREGYTRHFEKDPGSVVGHMRQADTKQVLKDAEEILKTWNCDYIFLTCQTNETIRAFRERFGNRLLTIERKLCNYEELAEGKSAAMFSQNVRSRNQLQHEREYITEIYLLSRCQTLLCSENSGSEGAFIMSEGYDFHHCYSLERG